jgi:hypothetical protein
MICCLLLLPPSPVVPRDVEDSELDPELLELFNQMTSADVRGWGGDVWSRKSKALNRSTIKNMMSFVFVFLKHGRD